MNVLLEVHIKVTDVDDQRRPYYLRSLLTKDDMFDGLMGSIPWLRQNLRQYFGVSFTYMVKFGAKLVYKPCFSLCVLESVTFPVYQTVLGF